MATKTLTAQKYPFPSYMMMMSLVFVVIGIVTFGIGVMSNPERLWASYLTSYFFFTTVAIGGLFFTAILNVTKAGWGVTMRRFVEAFSAFLPVAFIFGLILLIGGNHLYQWFNPEIAAKDHLIQIKAAYLNKGAFTFRLVLFFALWLWFGYNIVGKSLKQDKTGDDSLTLKALPWSVAFLIVFALSYSLFSVDTLMSLSPHWFSTIFGVYCFSGLFQAVMAMAILYLAPLVKNKTFPDYYNENHLHDVAKLMFAFTIFYAYIGFSQFMLIWYANIPEETAYFLARGHDGWMAVSMSLLVFKFIVPFFALLPRWVKRSPKHVVPIAILILVMEYVDIYWMVYPGFNEGRVVFSFWEIGVFLGFLGIFLIVVTRFLTKFSLIPIKDPRLHEALHHHI